MSFHHRAGATALALLLSFTPTAHGRDAIHAEDVVVTASRMPQSRASVIADVSVIERDDIERAGQSTLVELLQQQPGVEIASNGGAGKVSSVYLRGTNDQHVVVLVDGIRINSGTLGTTAFENIPLAQIDRVEILRGPASSLYGADAIGGVIQIFTRRGGQGLNFGAFAGYGSYHTKTAEASVSGGNENTRFGINLNSYDTDGFSARKTASAVDNDNDGYRNLGASAYLDHTLAPGHSLGLQFFHSKGRNQFDAGNGFADYSDQTLMSYALSSKNQITDFWHSTLKIGLGVDDSDNYAKPSISNRLGKSAYRTEQWQYTWQNDLTLPLGTLTLAYDRLEQDIDSQSSPTRGFNKTRDNDGWLATYLATLGAHLVQASLRRDDNSQYGQHSTGGLAYGYRITPHWRASLSYGTAFKAPTFNQLYFPNFGNPNLEPEKSRNYEAALRYQTGHANVGLTVFDNQIDQLIVFAPTPLNLSRANIQGATLDGQWYVGHWSLGGNFTLQSPRDDDTDKLLPRRSQRHGAINVGYQRGDWRLGAEVTGVSERYNNTTNTKRMDGYALLNLTASYALHDDWQLQARANNVFDKDYVLAYTGDTPTSAAYATPGANLFVGLRWQPQ